MSVDVMTDVKSVVEECSRGAAEGTLSFPQIVGRLAETGVEGYLCDLRRAVNTFYLPDGNAIEVAMLHREGPIAETFDAAQVEAAVHQSQRNEHTYQEFCRKVIAAGCAGYLVSLSGRRVMYFGRTAETHTEYFPGSR
jgi:uncharacterized protein YbcV (DUF1398 family)